MKIIITTQFLVNNQPTSQFTACMTQKRLGYSPVLCVHVPCTQGCSGRHDIS